MTDVRTPMHNVSRDAAHCTDGAVSAPGAGVKQARRWLGRRRRLILYAAGAMALMTLLLVCGVWLAVVLLPFDIRQLEGKVMSNALFDRNGRPLRAYLGNDEAWRIPVRLGEISPWLKSATLAVEDRRFYKHGGIDWLATLRAVHLNAVHGRIISGASTLSMQAAGFTLQRSRSVSWKVAQTFRALQLEHHRTKDEILQIYFTNAPYGGNVYGAEAAARRYFNKSAVDLTLSEAALLAGVPQSPSRLRPDVCYEAAMVRRAYVLRRMLDEGMIPKSDYDRVITQRPSVGKFDAPREAPHFSDFVHARYGGGARLVTTLDIDIQHQAQRILVERVRQLASANVTNGSLVVLDNASGDVLAMVGSADYDCRVIDGQVNGAVATRSPGSALKPLIYANAYECGGLLPSADLYDVPQLYRDYEPENFDKHFHGLVPADQALAWSLNLPAIQVLNETGLARSIRFMHSCGLTTLQRPAGDYGLSLAIGSCGIRLLDLTNAYAMLARGGVWKPYRVLAESARDTSSSETRTLLSPESCYFVTRALADMRMRPAEGVNPELIGLEGVAWKTGTSNGFKDAWTIAYDSKYTVGVWLGNFDGSPSHALVGAQAAAPVALGLIQRLRPMGWKPAGPWPARPANVRSVAVCAETGLCASVDCPSTRTAEAGRESASGAPPRICSVHKRVRIDVATGQQLCTRCCEERAYTERAYAFWPTPVAAWLAENVPSTQLPPAHLTTCTGAAGTAQLKITSPKPGDSFVISATMSAERQKLLLQATAPPSSKQLFWFLDGELVQVVNRDAPTHLIPTAGSHQLRCVDELGRADLVSFSVERPQ